MLNKFFRGLVPRSSRFERRLIALGRFFFASNFVQLYFYWRWRIHNEPNSSELQKQSAKEFETQPLIHIFIPVDAGHEHLIKQTLASLLQQTYTNWRAFVITNRDIKRPQDSRIHFIPSFKIEEADFYAQLPAGDSLPPFSLFEFVNALQTHPNACFCYSDSDSITPGGFRSRPFFRPAFSPVYQAESNYLPRFYLIAKKQNKNTLHIPAILYHQTQTSSQAIKEFPRLPVINHQPSASPKISIIIPSHDQAKVLDRCLQSIFASSYTNYEIILLENHSSEAQIFDLYDKLRSNEKIRVLTLEQTTFNYADLNNFGASQANGEILLFLNNDIEAITPNWIESMLGYVLQPQVGIIGAKLYYTDGTLQHAGAIVNEKIGSLHHHVHYPRNADGYFRNLQSAREVSAVTGACLMIRREVFEKIGGFDPQFRVDFNDMDLCLNARKHGYEIIFTPHAELYHHASITRGHSDSGAENARLNREKNLFLAKWDEYIQTGDPYFNPNLLILNSFMPFIPNPKSCKKLPRLSQNNSEYN